MIMTLWPSRRDFSLDITAIGPEGAGQTSLGQRPRKPKRRSPRQIEARERTDARVEEMRLPLGVTALVRVADAGRAPESGTVLRQRHVVIEMEHEPSQLPFVRFDAGEVVHAECGDMIGDPAVVLIVKSCDSLEKGVYKFVPGRTAATRTVLRSVTELMLDALRELDEARGAVEGDFR